MGRGAQGFKAEPLCWVGPPCCSPALYFRPQYVVIASVGAAPLCSWISICQRLKHISLLSGGGGRGVGELLVGEPWARGTFLLSLAGGPGRRLPRILTHPQLCLHWQLEWDPAEGWGEA